MKSLKHDEGENIRESMMYEESMDLLNEKYGDVDSPSRCRDCGGIILNEDNESIMRSEDYSDLCECAEARADLLRKYDGVVTDE